MLLSLEVCFVEARLDLAKMGRCQKPWTLGILSAWNRFLPSFHSSKGHQWARSLSTGKKRSPVTTLSRLLAAGSSGTSTGSHGFSHEIGGFPSFFPETPLNQFIDFSLDGFADAFWKGGLGLGLVASPFRRSTSTAFVNAPSHRPWRRLLLDP